MGPRPDPHPAPLLGIDPRELRGLITDHGRFVAGLLRSRAVPGADIDDATQEVFVVVARRYAERPRDAGIRSWLYSIAVRIASQRRRSHLRLVAREAVGLATSHIPDPEQQLGARDRLRRVESFMQSLPLAQREAFTLCMVEGMTVPEVAALSGTNLNTLYTRVRTTRRAFLRFLAKAESDHVTDRGGSS